MSGGGMYDNDELLYFDMVLGPELEMLANSGGSESACDVVWTDSNGNNVGEGMEISGLAAGSYTATMTHSNGCTSTQTVDVDFTCAGCTDPDAYNYNEDANIDDGSCIPVIEGCIDSSACNLSLIHI